jgi:hypothetical protein
MTRARAKAIHDKVNSLLSSHAFDTSWDGSLPHAETLCIIRYEGSESPPPKSSNAHSRRNEEERDHRAVAVLPLSHSGTTAGPVAAGGTTALAAATAQVAGSTGYQSNQRTNQGSAVVAGTYGGTTAGPGSSDAPETREQNRGQRYPPVPEAVLPLARNLRPSAAATRHHSAS